MSNLEVLSEKNLTQSNFEGTQKKQMMLQLSHKVTGRAKGQKEPSEANTIALLQISYRLEPRPETANFLEVSSSTISLEGPFSTALFKVSNSYFLYMEYSLVDLTYQFILLVAYQEKTSEMQYFIYRLSKVCGVNLWFLWKTERVHEYNGYRIVFMTSPRRYENLSLP